MTTSSCQEYKCKVCDDSQFVDVDPENPITGMKPCVCREQIRIDYINSMIPDLFKGADLNTLTPITERSTKQAKVIQLLQAHPFDSYLFVGKNMAGKTWFSYALFKNAALSGRRAIAVSMADLISEFKRAELSNEDWKERITPEDLSQNRDKYTILIDEVEKSRVSEFSAERFFNLIRAAKDYKHQLLVTSNMTEAQLTKHFSKADEVYGESIIRRLKENAHIVDMF